MLLPLSCSNFAFFRGGRWCQGAQRNQGAEEEDCKPVDICNQIKQGGGKKKIISLKPLHHFCKTSWFCAACQISKVYRHEMAELVMNISRRNLTTRSKINCTHLLGVSWRAWRAADLAESSPDFGVQAARCLECCSCGQSSCIYVPWSFASVAPPWFWGFLLVRV